MNNPRAAVPEVTGLSAQPTGWFVHYSGQNAREVVCWGLISDGSGGTPLVFDKASGKLVAAISLGADYDLIHNESPDNSVVLLGPSAEPVSGQAISLGGLFSRKMSLVTSDNPAVVFSARLEGSLDAQDWFQFAILDSLGVENEVLTTIHYVRATLDSVAGGTVTIRLAWSLQIEGTK